MRGTIEVWGYPKCGICRAVKARLEEAGFAVDERDLATVQQGGVRDIEVLTQITMQVGAAPVIRVNQDEFVRPEDLETWLAGKER